MTLKFECQIKWKKIRKSKTLFLRNNFMIKIIQKATKSVRARAFLPLIGKALSRHLIKIGINYSAHNCFSENFNNLQFLPTENKNAFTAM